ncbi:D-alanyl-D-alanine carboxypeptidase family protein [Streptomyces sp. TRM 70351]|uniref:D-alanyl-D-alanine carboxypeptidase family protein n=1 Tax=Streptomyces sp. TRM 70351 TaxID=3116552 RepID=UPI003FCC6839
MLHTVGRSVARTAVAGALVLPLFAGAAAPVAAEEPAPPAAASTVGGERLGRPGTQVAPLAGAEAPALPRKLTARAWMVADAETGEVLAAHNAHWPLAPASTLKMLFADTLLPKFDSDLSYTVLPEDLAPMGVNSSAVGVKENHAYTVHDLWNGVFLASGNDAVHALAALNGGLAKTVREMNEHAAALGARDTHVVSPDGYDAPGQRSSAYDLTLIARSGLGKPAFRTYAATATARFPGGGEGADREHYQIQTTNRLLLGSHGLTPYEGLAGIKNGYTSEAGYTFTGVAQRGGRSLLVTVMHPAAEKGGNGVYEESAQLLDWGFAAAGKVEPVGELVPPEGAGTTRRVARPGKDERAPEGLAGGGVQAAGDGFAVDAPRGSDGVGVALGVVGGTLVILGGTAYAVRRRWPRHVDAP